MQTCICLNGPANSSVSLDNSSHWSFQELTWMVGEVSFQRNCGAQGSSIHDIKCDLVKKIILGPTARRVSRNKNMAGIGKKKKERKKKKKLHWRYLKGKGSLDGKFGWNPKPRSTRKGKKCLLPAQDSLLFLPWYLIFRWSVCKQFPVPTPLKQKFWFYQAGTFKCTRTRCKTCLFNYFEMLKKTTQMRPNQLRATYVLIFLITSTTTWQFAAYPYTKGTRRKIFVNI